MSDIFILQKFRILVIQGCILLPVIVSLSMGRRTTKMAYATDFLNFGYWLIVAVEAAHLVETALVDHRYIHMVFPTEITISIVMVIANSYGLVTLVSFISPVSASLRRKYNTKFDFVFKVIVGVAGIFFAEVPFTVARFQILILDLGVLLPGTFYLWAVKDVIFIIMILFVLGVRRLGQTYKRTCAPIAKHKTYFQPEKRDVYHARRVRFQTNQDQDTASITGSYQFVMKNGKFSLVKKVIDAEDGLEQKNPCGLSTLQEEDETSSHSLDNVSQSHGDQTRLSNVTISVVSEKPKPLEAPCTSRGHPNTEPTKGIYNMYSLNRQKDFERPIPMKHMTDYETPVSSVESLEGIGSISEHSGARQGSNRNTPQIVVATIERPECPLDLEDPEDMEVRMINQPRFPALIRTEFL